MPAKNEDHKHANQFIRAIYKLHILEQRPFAIMCLTPQYEERFNQGIYWYDTSYASRNKDNHAIIELWQTELARNQQRQHKPSSATTSKGLRQLPIEMVDLSPMAKEAEIDMMETGFVAISADTSEDEKDFIHISDDGTDLKLDALQQAEDLLSPEPWNEAQILNDKIQLQKNNIALALHTGICVIVIPFNLNPLITDKLVFLAKCLDISPLQYIHVTLADPQQAHFYCRGLQVYDYHTPPPLLMSSSTPLLSSDKLSQLILELPAIDLIYTTLSQHRKDLQKVLTMIPFSTGSVWIVEDWKRLKRNLLISIYIESLQSHQIQRYLPMIKQLAILKLVQRSHFQASETASFNQACKLIYGTSTLIDEQHQLKSCVTACINKLAKLDYSAWEPEIEATVTQLITPSHPFHEIETTKVSKMPNRHAQFWQTSEASKAGSSPFSSSSSHHQSSSSNHG